MNLICLNTRIAFKYYPKRLVVNVFPLEFCPITTGCIA